MLKVIDIFPIGNKFSITLDGTNDKLANGSRLIDNEGNIVTVKSVAMVRHTNVGDIGKSTTILADKCDVKIGSELSIA